MTDLDTTASPLYDRTAMGDGVALESPPIPTVPETIAKDEIEQLEELRDWWSGEAEKDAEKCLKKLIEYGSSDLDIMAHSMLAVGGTLWEGVPDAERMRVGREMAIAFYLQGKVARAFGAFEHGRMPTTDTIDDIVRYGMMWKRIRQTGAWK